MKIVIEKKFGENKEMTFEVNNKDEFIWALGNMWDAMAEEVKPSEEECAKKFWDRLLEKTPFDTIQEFNAWMGEMRDYEIISKDFDWCTFRADTVNDYITEHCCYDCLDDLLDKIEELESAMYDIKEITRQYC